MSQTTVNNKQPIGLAGQWADLFGAVEGAVISKANAEASAEIPFGVMVCRGTGSDNQAKLLHTSAAAMVATPLLLGISLWHQSYANPSEVSDNNKLTPGTAFGVATSGHIYVYPEDNVTPASDVRVRVVVTGNEVAGAFRGAADTTDCVDISAFARWLTSGGPTSPAVLEFDMSNVSLAVADT